MSSADRTRVLVVDDSAFARKVLRLSLEKHPKIEVVGIASDGLEALEKIVQLQPDVITLDLMMPNLDGIGVLRELASAKSAVRTVIVSTSDDDSELVAKALQLGAVGLVKKPTALATDRLYELAPELITMVLAAGGARVSSRSAVRRESSPSIISPVVARHRAPVKLLVVGTSTGGPHALTRLLQAFPASFPVPVAIALHIPGEYTEALASRLDEACALTVVEASDGMMLTRGMVAIAKGGMQLIVARVGDAARLRVEFDSTLPYAPSVNQLFESAAASFGSEVLAMVLTGMGDDGLLGAQAVVAGGGRVLTQSEASCVIYGMPRSVRAAGLSDGEYPLEEMLRETLLRIE